GPARARTHHLRWRTRISAALVGHHWSDALLARFDSITTDWATVARRIAASLRPGDIPTLYGMGWNGQSLMTELAAALPTTPIAWIDDTPTAAAPSSIVSQRISAQDLTLRHAVIVTPNDPTPMLAKLAAKRVIWPAAQRAKAA